MGYIIFGNAFIGDAVAEYRYCQERGIKRIAEHSLVSFVSTERTENADRLSNGGDDQVGQR